MIINYTLLLFILSFMISGCGGEEFKGAGMKESLSSSQCLECHGNELEDTHYDISGTAQIEGYLLDMPVSWAPDGMGYVLRDSDNACYASCHNYHYTDLSISQEWQSSGHADINSPAFTHNFTSGVCLRCHSGIGFANYVDSSNTLYPDWSPQTSDISSHHITCNSCHNATSYPSISDPVLRIIGNVEFISGATNTLVFDGTISGAGPSAVCIICHQGRESGWSLYKAMLLKGVDPYNGIDELITDQNFVNPHYLAAGSMLFSYKGYEFKGDEFSLTFTGTYSRGVLQHQVLSCTGCHMAKTWDKELGGHTLKMAEGTKKMNISLCRQCHPGINDFNIYGRKEDIEALKAEIIQELQKSGRGNGEGIFYNPDVYPYFFRTSDPQQQTYANRVTQWKETELIAAFNLQFVNKEKGAYVHNYTYAMQLLYDSLKALGVDPSIPRPSRNDRKAIIYN